MTHINSLFFKSILNNLDSHIAVTDEKFNIVFVNDSWINFGIKNGVKHSFNWLGVKYFQEVKPELGNSPKIINQILQGIDKVNSNLLSKFEIDYPCHSSSENRWFTLHLSRMQILNEAFYVFNHVNSTEQICAEKFALQLWWAKNKVSCISSD